MISHHSSALALWPIRIDFHCGNASTKTIYFLGKPLGMHLTDNAPFKVRAVDGGGLAQLAGVREGWEVIRIGNQVISSSTGGDDVTTYLRNGLDPLPESRVASHHHFMAAPTTRIEVITTGSYGQTME